MVTILGKFLKIENLPSDKLRSAYGKLCGVVGIVLNLILFGIKLLAGLLSNSIAITADAVNNLSDAGTSLVTLAGFKLAEQKPDSDHPFGHGRIEYLSGLLVSAVILMMAFELLMDSVAEIFNPSPVEFSIPVLVILMIAILIKLYMAFYNFSIGKRIDSAALKATGTDSLSDCISTTIVLLATVIGYISDLKIDGFCGVIVAILIFLAGYNAAKETLDPLLGQPPEPEYVERIEQIVLEYDKESIVGVHDLIVHDYGPGRRIISLHAEVPAEGNMMALHDVIDNLEMKLRQELGCLATIHMDPVVTKDERVKELKEKCNLLLKRIGNTLSLHDFRVVFGDTHTNMIFDVVIPYEFALSDSETVKLIQEHVWKEFGKNYYVVIQVDKGGL